MALNVKVTLLHGRETRRMRKHGASSMQNSSYGFPSNNVPLFGLGLAIVAVPLVVGIATIMN